jgi:hypothetical protein
MSLAPIYGTRTVIALALAPIAMLLLCVSNVSAQSSGSVLVERIDVLNELGSGIESEIRILDAHDNDTHFAYTDGKGISHPNRDCSGHARLDARPKIRIYRKIRRPPYCAPEVQIVLEQAGVADHIARKGDEAAKAGQYQVASMLYSESAYRLEDTDPQVASILRRKAFISFQEAYPKIELLTYDFLQEQVVLSPEGTSFLKAIQREERLNPTGMLDTLTLQKITGQKIFPHIKDAYRSASLDSPREPYKWDPSKSINLGGPIEGPPSLKFRGRIRPQ